MEQQVFFPDHLRKPLCDKLSWFLSNSSVEYLRSTCWCNKPPWFIPRRSLMDTFILFPENPIFIGTEQEEKIIEPGEFFMAPVGCWHWYGIPEGAVDCRHMIFHTMINSKLHINPIEIFPSPFHKIDNYDNWLAALKNLESLGTDKSAAKKYAEMMLQKLLLELITNEEKQISIPNIISDVRINDVVRLIEDRFDEDLSIEFLAETANLRPVQFRKVFKRQTERTPKEFIVETRIKNACKLLQNSSPKIKEIAFTCGFNNEYYFSTTFKSRTGLSPSQFRSQYVNKTKKS